MKAVRVFLCSFGLSLLAGCSTQLGLDPGGYRCDADASCPAGFVCEVGFCRSAPVCPGDERCEEGPKDACQDILCGTPPASSCASETTLRVFAAQGSCASDTGACSYASSEVPCAQGCVNGVCVGEPCAGVACVTPPASVCADGTTLRTFAAVGECQAAHGQCDYAAHDVTCAQGCEAGACRNQNLCAGQSCVTPPGPVCVPGAVRTFAGPGACVPASGQCQYAFTDTPCSNCQDGQCWMAMTQTLPANRTQVNAVDQVPGSHGAHVLAVGQQGYVARFDGASWGVLPSGTQSHLRAVWLASPGFGLVAGDDSTLLRYDGQSLSRVTLPAAPPTSLVSVHGTGPGQVLVAGVDGRYFRYGNGQWTTGLLPADKGPYGLRAAFVDAQGRERLVGGCKPNSSGCVGSGCGCVASASSGTASFTVKLDSATPIPFTAAGPSLENESAGYAFLGRMDGIRRHLLPQDFDSVHVPTWVGGTQVVGISDSECSTGEAVYVLSSGGPNERGRLTRHVRDSTALSADPPLLWLDHDVASMSRNDSSGVVVADSKPQGASVFRVGPQTFEVYDLVESYRAVSRAVSGDLFLMNGYGDLAVRRSSSGKLELYASPVVNGAMRDVAAGASLALLVGDGGRAFRFDNGAFTELSGGGVQNLLSACRMSDDEWYVVGEAGKAFRSDGQTLSPLPTPPGTGALYDVFCAGPQNVVAVGAQGVVLKLSGGAFTGLTPAAPTSTALLSVWASPQGTVYVSGNNVFLRYEGGAWKPLPALPVLHSLAVRGPKEVYGAAGDKVLQFDGTRWTPRLQASSALTRGEVSAGGAVWVGMNGVVIEGR